MPSQEYTAAKTGNIPCDRTSVHNKRTFDVNTTATSSNNACANAVVQGELGSIMDFNNSHPSSLLQLMAVQIQSNRTVDLQGRGQVNITIQLDLVAAGNRRSQRLLSCDARICHILLQRHHVPEGIQRLAALPHLRKPGLFPGQSVIKLLGFVDGGQHCLRVIDFRQIIQCVNRIQKRQDFRRNLRLNRTGGGNLFLLYQHCLANLAVSSLCQTGGRLGGLNGCVYSFPVTNGRNCLGGFHAADAAGKALLSGLCAGGIADYLKDFERVLVLRKNLLILRRLRNLPLTQPGIFAAYRAAAVDCLLRTVCFTDAGGGLLVRRLLLRCEGWNLDQAQAHCRSQEQRQTMPPHLF